ncbi:helix-turn-helix domain-containing protein [Nocardia sp. CA-107356]|uniref:helix-turn-helix domain-containing protein n=1 Tax=Nocardia sp. CA-107356 TaxID=3239972 RepID=UPI003D8B9A3E
MDSDYWWEEDSPDDSETNPDRREHWRDYLLRRQGTFGLAFSDRDNNRNFGWKTIAQAVGDLQIVRFSSDPVHYHRTARDAKADGDDGFRLMLPVHGEFRLRQGDDAGIFRPGDVALIRWDSGVIMRQDAPLDALIMTVPAHSVDHDLAGDAPLALDASRPLIASLVGQMSQLHANHGQWTSHDFSIAYRSALFLLEGVLHPTRAVTEQGHAFLAAQAREKMETHADEPNLTLEAVAEMCKVSHRTLHTALTETFGVTPAALLRKIRLDRAYQRLSKPGRVDMNWVVRAAGYTSVRGFSDAFRRQHEQTPRELREQLNG